MSVNRFQPYTIPDIQQRMQRNNNTFYRYYSSDAITMLTNIVPIVDGVQLLNFYYRQTQPDTMIQHINIIDFDETDVNKLKFTQKCVVAEWFYQLLQNGAIKDEMYQKYCACAFPEYVSNKDVKCMQYWDDYHKYVQENELSTLDQWPVPLHHFDTHSGAYSLTSKQCVDAYKLCNSNQRALITYLIQQQEKKHHTNKYNTNQKQPKNKIIKSSAVTCIENRIIFNILRTLDINENMKKCFTLISVPSQSHIYREIESNCAKYLHLGIKIMNEPDAIIPEFNVTYQRQFNVINKRINTNQHQAPILNKITTLRYVRLSYNINTRDDVKGLNNFFPYTCEPDKRHMTSNVAAFIYNYVNPRISNPMITRHTKRERVNHLNELLKYIAIGTNQVLVLCLLTMALGHERSQIMTDVILHSGVCCVDDKHKHKLLKFISIAVRRTQRLADGTTIDAKTISALCYYELAFGRALFLSNWQQEIMNRTSKTNHIQLRDPIEHQFFAGTSAIPRYQTIWRQEEDILAENTTDDEMFYDQLSKEMDIIMRTLLPYTAVEEDFTDFLRRRSEWCVAGSSGGAKICVPVTSVLNRNVPGTSTNNGLQFYLKADKRAYLESLSIDNLLPLLDSEPIEFAKASEKLENGKARAIYGVAMSHYIINSYCTFNLEESQQL